jgi:hypothetical protein
VHAPFAHVWLALHALPLFCHCPVAPHTCGCWPLHRTALTAHTPWQDAEPLPEPPACGPPSPLSSSPTQVWPLHGWGLLQVPAVEQVTTAFPEHDVWLGAQAP